MQTKFALFLAAAFSFVMVNWQAQATPLSATKNIYQTNATILVVNQCISGWHWDPVAKKCVRNP